MNKGDRIRQVEGELVAVRKEIESLSETYRLMGEQIKQRQGRLKDLQNQREMLVPKQIQVSDHAVLRYLERALNVDVEAHRREILTMVSPDGTFATESQGFVIRNNVVTTYIPKEE